MFCSSVSWPSTCMRLVSGSLKTPPSFPLCTSRAGPVTCRKSITFLYSVTHSPIHQLQMDLLFFGQAICHAETACNVKTAYEWQNFVMGRDGATDSWVSRLCTSSFKLWQAWDVIPCQIERRLIFTSRSWQG